MQYIAILQYHRDMIPNIHNRDSACPPLFLTEYEKKMWTRPRVFASDELAAMAAQELVSLEGSTSAVWKYFDFPAKDGQCVECVKRKQDRV